MGRDIAISSELDRKLFLDFLEAGGVDMSTVGDWFDNLYGFLQTYIGVQEEKHGVDFGESTDFYFVLVAKHVDDLPGGLAEYSGGHVVQMKDIWFEEDEADEKFVNLFGLDPSRPHSWWFPQAKYAPAIDDDNDSFIL